MGGQQEDFISDIVFFQHQDGMRLKVRRHFLQWREGNPEIPVCLSPPPPSRYAPPPKENIRKEDNQKGQKGFILFFEQKKKMFSFWSSEKLTWTGTTGIL